MVGVSDLRRSQSHLALEISSCKVDSGEWGMKTKVLLSRAHLVDLKRKERQKTAGRSEREFFFVPSRVNLDGVYRLGR